MSFQGIMLATLYPLFFRRLVESRFGHNIPWVVNHQPLCRVSFSEFPIGVHHVYSFSAASTGTLAVSSAGFCMVPWGKLYRYAISFSSIWDHSILVW